MRLKQRLEQKQISEAYYKSKKTVDNNTLVKPEEKPEPKQISNTDYRSKKTAGENTLLTSGEKRQVSETYHRSKKIVDETAVLRSEGKSEQKQICETCGIGKKTVEEIAPLKPKQKSKANYKSKRKAGKNNLPTMDQIQKEQRRLHHRISYNRALRSTVNVLIVVAAIAVLISSLVFPVLQISGDSMDPTLKDGNIIVLYKTTNLKTGDLCSFTWNNRTLIKRIIAGPGDWIEIDAEGNVYVNDVMLDEPYVSEKSVGECDIEFPYQVPDNSYFMMGDKRATSIDSRSTVIGSVNVEQIIGKVWLRIYPFDLIGFM